MQHGGSFRRTPLISGGDLYPAALHNRLSLDLSSILPAAHKRKERRAKQRAAL